MANICPCTIGNSISKALFNLRDAKKCSIPEQTSSATVLSHAVRHNNSIYHEDPWQYLVVFRLENGEELELSTSEDVYKTLTEGTSGILTRQDGKLISFE